jgi:hypothetical protein
MCLTGEEDSFLVDALPLALSQKSACLLAERPGTHLGLQLRTFVARNWDSSDTLDGEAFAGWLAVACTALKADSQDVLSMSD